VCLILQVGLRSPSLEASIIIWSVLAVILGVMGDFILFGDLYGFHGVGAPIPIVLFDEGSDFPNSLGVVENPIVIWLLGVISMMVLKVALAMKSR
jgi:hypothetical protein